ncbi:hypothetical protein Tco_0146094 [Tanacetum coccineum]
MELTTSQVKRGYCWEKEKNMWLSYDGAPSGPDSNGSQQTESVIIREQATSKLKVLSHYDRYGQFRNDVDTLGLRDSKHKNGKYIQFL